MGRNSTGASTCEASVKITISELLESRVLQKGRKISGTISWTMRSGTKCQVQIDTCWQESDRYIRLTYQVTDQEETEKIDYDYQVHLTSVPSNLGKGEVLYFICPDTSQRCRILYMSYGSHIWKSREAYSHRLYYRSQISSKMNYANDRYWAIDRKLKDVRKQKYLHLRHSGLPTSKAQYIQALEERQDHWDFERWQPTCMPLSLRKLIFKV